MELRAPSGTGNSTTQTQHHHTSLSSHWSKYATILFCFLWFCFVSCLSTTSMVKILKITTLGRPFRVDATERFFSKPWGLTSSFCRSRDKTTQGSEWFIQRFLKELQGPGNSSKSVPGALGDRGGCLPGSMLVSTLHLPLEMLRFC